MCQHPKRAIIPALAALAATARIPQRIHDAIHAPDGAQDTDSDGVLEACNGHCAEGSGVVFIEVLVGALCGVEGEHGGFGRRRRRLHLLVRRVFERVWDFGGFATPAYVAAVPDAYEEGGDCGEQDVAVGLSVDTVF